MTMKSSNEELNDLQRQLLLTIEVTHLWMAAIKAREISEKDKQIIHDE